MERRAFGWPLIGVARDGQAVRQTTVELPRGGRRGSACRGPDRRPFHPPGGAGPDRVRSSSATSPDGGPPYRVRWEPDGHTGLFYPAGTAAVVHRTGPSHS